MPLKINLSKDFTPHLLLPDSPVQVKYQKIFTRMVVLRVISPTFEGEN